MTHGRVFITGATGCVGSHLLRSLVERTSFDVVALVRDARRLPAWARANPRIRLLEEDMRDAARVVAAQSPFDRAVLLAASWKEEPEASEVNHAATVALLKSLGDTGCPHAVYVSTASLLGRDGVPLAAADAGTPYIRSKLAALRALGTVASSMVITTVFPTLVAGDGDGAPASQAAFFLRAIARRAWLLRWLSAEGSFHVIHPMDLASLIRQALTSPLDSSPAAVVAGGVPVTVDEAIDDVVRLVGRRRLGRVPLTRSRIDTLLRIFRVQLSPWDRHCLEQRHFVYEGAVASLDANEPARYPTFGDVCRAVLASVGTANGGASESTRSGTSASATNAVASVATTAPD
jgi:nucleoside-diphosphate-sugar epimerase